jgi:hypothetical protein
MPNKDSTSFILYNIGIISVVRSRAGDIPVVAAGDVGNNNTQENISKFE